MTRLDEQYDTSYQLADRNVAPYFERFVAESAQARARLTGSLDVRYGEHERETVDFFPAKAAGAPLFVWVHGGYWRRMSKNESTYVAPPLVDKGAAVAIVNYPLAPGSTLDDIVASVRRGFAFARDRAADLNADPERIVVGGHSVGAQLAAMTAAAFEVRGLFALSGLYDLQPLRETSVNDAIAMDAATADRNAPLNNPPLGDPSLVIACGGREQRAFFEQQAAFVAAWLRWGHPVRTIAAPEHNHFTIALDLTIPSSLLSAALLTLLELKHGSA